MTSQKKIAIVDYGVGNLYNVVKAVKIFTDRFVISEEPLSLQAADAVIIPGVGSFAAGMDGLRIRGLDEALKQFAESGKPMLGICLGAQLMMDRGYEFGVSQGLSIVPGEVVPFPELGGGAKVPHIGWSAVYKKGQTQWRGSVLASVDDKNTDMYFIHSFIFKPENDEHALAWSRHGGCEFPSMLKKGAVYGCQFHPEKSGEAGLSIIKNFIASA